MSAWNGRDDLAVFLLDYFCRITGMSRTERIVMPDGTTTTVQEAMRRLRGAVHILGRVAGRRAEALRAAAAEYPGGAHLAWFAQRLAMRTASDLAVMGHTHSVVGGLTISPVSYVNSGYLCVARPDAPRTQITFTQVDLERASAQVMAVVETPAGWRVVPATAPVMRSAIIGPRTRLLVLRPGAEPLRPAAAACPDTEGSRRRSGVVPPPGRIAPHARADIWLSDTVGPRGSAGGFTYTDGTSSLDFGLACPTGLGGNVVRSPVADYETKTEDRAWRRGGVDHFGHPVQARFFIGAPVRSGPGPAAPAGPARANGRVSSGPSAPPAPAPRRWARTQESPYVVAMRAILDRARTPRERGVVMCVAHLTSRDGTPLLDPTTEPPTGPRVRLKHPPNHLLSPEVQTITVGGTEYRYVWIQPNIPPVSPPNAGGVAFLPAAGAPEFTLVTFNVAGLDNDFNRSCRNDHHAEMQVVGFINAQPPRWRTNIQKLALLNRSRRGPTWGYSACNACLSDLASFLRGFSPGSLRASISWERLYDKNPRCHHPTDAANVARLVAAGWDKPQGPMPVGTPWIREAHPGPHVFTA